MVNNLPEVNTSNKWQSQNSDFDSLTPGSIFFLIEVQLIYSVVLISAVRQSASVTHIYVFIFFSIMTYHRTLNIVPCAVQSDLIVYSIYDSWCLLIRTPSPSLSHPSCPLVTTSLFSVTVSLSVSLVCSLVFQIPHVSDIVWYLCFCDLLCLV